MIILYLQQRRKPSCWMSREVVGSSWSRDDSGNALLSPRTPFYIQAPPREFPSAFRSPMEKGERDFTRPRKTRLFPSLVSSPVESLCARLKGVLPFVCSARKGSFGARFQSALFFWFVVRQIVSDFLRAIRKWVGLVFAIFFSRFCDGPVGGVIGSIANL